MSSNLTASAGCVDFTWLGKHGDVQEIRISDAKGIFRVMYVAKFEQEVYVLHCFQKKTQATLKQDKDIAAARYRAVVNARKEKR